MKTSFTYWKDGEHYLGIAETGLERSAPPLTSRTSRRGEASARPLPCRRVTIAW